MIQEKALDWIIKAEGGYVDDPDDKGGETKYGITKVRYPELDIPNLTEEKARQIYVEDFWNVCRCPELNPIPAILVFDAAVNHSPRRSIKMLQQAVGEMEDGIIGPRTITAANSYGERYLLKKFLTIRLFFYHRLSVKNQTQERFLRKLWIPRVILLQQFMNDEGIL